MPASFADGPSEDILLSYSNGVMFSYLRTRNFRCLSSEILLISFILKQLDQLLVRVSRTPQKAICKTMNHFFYKAVLLTCF